MAEKIDYKTIATKLFSKQKEILLQLPVAEREQAKLLIFLSVHTSLEIMKQLMTSGNTFMVNQIIDELEKLMKDSLPKVVVKVRSMAKLAVEDLAKIKDILETELKKEVILETQIDSSILGGVVIEYEGKIIDLTLDEQISRLKQHLLKNIT